MIQKPTASARTSRRIGDAALGSYVRQYCEVRSTRAYPTVRLEKSVCPKALKLLARYSEYKYQLLCF
jgi:hypothetical protein